jgi:hypothetical protein
MNKYLYLLNMESVYHIVTIRVNETSWAYVWRLCSLYLGMGYDTAHHETSAPDFINLDKISAVALKINNHD